MSGKKEKGPFALVRFPSSTHREIIESYVEATDQDAALKIIADFFRRQGRKVEITKEGKIILNGSKTIIMARRLSLLA